MGSSMVMTRNGIDSARITLHEKTPAALNAGTLQADELATGGFVSSFYDLLRGLLFLGLVDLGTRDEELPDEEDRQRQGDGQDEVALVIH